MFRTNNCASSGGLYKQLTVHHQEVCTSSLQCIIRKSVQAAYSASSGGLYKQLTVHLMRSLVADAIRLISSKHVEDNFIEMNY
jgi:hypothetical protein